MTFKDTLDALVTLGYPERAQYLRDLKASHDVLLKAYKSHADFCDDDRCRSCETERTIIKAAEGLK